MESFLIPRVFVPDTPMIVSLRQEVIPRSRRGTRGLVFDLFPIPRRISTKQLIYHNSLVVNDGFDGLSGTLSGKLVAVALVMLLHPSVKCCLIIIGFARRVLVYPLIELCLKRVYIPLRKVMANSNDGAF